MASKSKTSEPLWFPKDYWDRPEPLQHGTKDMDKLYRAVGVALSGWETLEQQLSAFFILLTIGETVVHGNMVSTIARIYGAIESNSGRRKILDAVAEVYFGKEMNNPLIKKPYFQLMENIRRASNRRDDIAHARVIGFQLSQVGRGYFLVPPEYHNSRNDLFVNMDDTSDFQFFRGHYRYTAQDVMIFAGKFGSLREAVSDFFLATQKKDGKLDFDKIAKSYSPDPEGS